MLRLLTEHVYCKMVTMKVMGAVVIGGSLQTLQFKS